MHNTTACLFVFACFFLQVAGFSLYGGLKSYAKLERWPTTGAGNKNSVTLRFKTNVETGLLFYVDDGDTNQFLAFYLRDGFLVVEINDGVRTMKVSSGTVVSDLVWHSVAIETSSLEVVLRINDRSLAEFTTANPLVFKSYVYIGGFPIFMDDDLVYSDAAYMQRFLGCVEDVRFGNSSTDAVIVKSVGLGKKCLDACKTENPCKHRGVCVNKFAKAECVCTGTGFTGDTCQEELIVVGIPTSYDGVIIDISSGTVSVLQTTSILIRFRSSRSNGVLFYTADKGDFILLELSNGALATTVNLGSGSVIITTKNDSYNDSQWHVVRLNRVKRMVSISVDGLAPVQGVTKGNFTAFGRLLPRTSVNLGGLSDTLLKERSISRSNYTGCLQELIFNDYDIFSKLDTITSDVRPRSTIIFACPNTTVSTTMVIPTSGFNTSTFQPTTSSATTQQASSEPTTRKTDTEPSLVSVVTSEMKTSHPTNRSSFPTSNHISTLPTDPTSEVDRTTFVPSSYTDGQTQTNPNTKATTTFNERTWQNNAVPARSTDIIMANQNERAASEKDLTLWFILAAAIAILAFLLAVFIIIKVHATNNKRYNIKESRVVLNDTGGSFQRSSGGSKSLV